MEDRYAQNLAREKRRCFIEACVINGLILAYLFAAAAYLFFVFGPGLDKGAGLWGRLASVLGPLALILAPLWTRSPASPGRAFIERTNPFLKNLRRPSAGSWWLTFSGLTTLAVLALTVVLGWRLTEVQMRALFSADGIAGAGRIFSSLFQPNLSASILVATLQAMVVTIFIALLATMIAVPLAFVGSFFCARNLMRGSALSLTIYNALRLIFNFTRSIEPLIWAIIFSVWVGIGPFAGMLALMLHSVASLVKLYSEQIENIDPGPIEAIEATGASRVQVIWFAVVPQIVLPYLSFTIYRWDINIRMATVIGLVGGGGIGTLLMQYQGLAKWNEVGTMVITIALVVWAMDYLSARIREAIY